MGRLAISKGRKGKVCPKLEASEKLPDKEDGNGKPPEKALPGVDAGKDFPPGGRGSRMRRAAWRASVFFAVARAPRPQVSC